MLIGDAGDNEIPETLFDNNALFLGVAGGALYVNPAGASGNETIFTIADNGTSRWSIDKEGDATATGSLLATAASQSFNLFEVQDKAANRLFTVNTTSTSIGSASGTYALELSGARVGSSPVALAGRVLAKVNLEGGVIMPGDPVTSSSVRSAGGVGHRCAAAGSDRVGLRHRRMIY